MKATFIRSLILAGLALPFVAQQAKADSITFDASPKTGSAAKVQVTMNNTDNPGKITVTVTSVPEPGTGNIGDINGIYLNLPSGVGTLSVAGVSGGPVTNVVQGTGVNNLGDGVNMNGGSGYSSFNLGLRIGYSGGASNAGTPDDFQTTTFTLSDTSGTLTLASLSGLDFGVRLKSVGPAGGNRSGSSKVGESVGSVVASNPGTGGGSQTPGGGETPGGSVTPGGGTTGGETPGGGGTPGGETPGTGGEPTSVPEPTTLGGLALGFGALMKWRSSRRTQKN
ncbi:MAG: PEP-CTERM sorting domain-containing protein [Oscillatoria princeps RMCB-10]|jgi:hypothetical protein|nr:PEP-CTERM sorting domain-containing protein [Oscillatoria princeps RMCB-10]